MSEKVRYQVRARALIDMVNALRSKSLVLSPHFQRKLVWREIHKIDFIKTILLGYPFPEIFIARGGIDVENMTSVSCVVDGQQRMNAISEFVSDKFSVDGSKYSELSGPKKEEILKYEIPVIELYLEKSDPEVIQIFKRLNRTFYSLSQIEKLSSEYASSYFMLIAKMNCGELMGFDEETGTTDERYNVSLALVDTDPNVTDQFLTWGNEKEINSIREFILKKNIFSAYEISRQVHLMYVLNLQATFLSGFYARNEAITTALDDYTEEFSEKDNLVLRCNNAANKLLSMELSNFWFSKSNSFSLMVALDTTRENWDNFNWDLLQQRLNDFSSNVPPDYAIAAKEAVNNKKERLLRNSAIANIINESFT